MDVIWGLVWLAGLAFFVALVEAVIAGLRRRWIPRRAVEQEEDAKESTSRGA
jgi:hypothetical protein